MSFPLSLAGLRSPYSPVIVPRSWRWLLESNKITPVTGLSPIPGTQHMLSASWLLLVPLDVCIANRKEGELLIFSQVQSVLLGWGWGVEGGRGRHGEGRTSLAVWTDLNPLLSVHPQRGLSLLLRSYSKAWGGRKLFCQSCLHVSKPGWPGTRPWGFLPFALLLSLCSATPPPPATPAPLGPTRPSPGRFQRPGGLGSARPLSFPPPGPPRSPGWGQGCGGGGRRGGESPRGAAEVRAGAARLAAPSITAD